MHRIRTTAFFAHIVHKPFRRLKTLFEMAKDTKEVVGGGLSTYIAQGESHSLLTYTATSLT